MKLYLVLCVFILHITALKLNGMFSNNMVLQHDMPINIWGSSNGTSVSVTLASTTLQGTVSNSRFMATLPKMTPGGPHKLIVKDSTGKTIEFSNILIGDVYLCSGQSNMVWNTIRTLNPQPEIEDSDNYPTLRFFTAAQVKETKPVEDLRGNGWHVANRNVTGSFSAVCYFFGRAIQRRRKIPIGLVVSAVGGTAIELWMSKEAQAKCPGENPAAAPHYNGMIWPLRHMKMKGSLWYQGESNSRAAPRYACLLPGMIAEWRKIFSNDFHFLNVQLAGYENGEFRMLRWVQQTAQIPKYFMATAVDLGEMTDIHPRRKREVGERLELIAANKIYGDSGVICHGSEVVGARATQTGNKVSVRVEFSDMGGGFEYKPTAFCTTCCDAQGKNTMFEIVDKQDAIYPTLVQMKDDHFLVEANVAQGRQFKQLVYAWKKFPQCMLYNKKRNLPTLPWMSS